MKSTIRSYARFSAAPARRRVEGGFAVYPDAHIFSVGDFPDKRFSMNESEAAAAVAGFEPVSGDIEHTRFLKGRAVQVRSLRLDADGKRLRGEVAVPLALDELIEDAERKLSAEWDRETKRLVGVALTLNPRVEEASLIAGFTATLQRITREAGAGRSLAAGDEGTGTERRVEMTAKEKLQKMLDDLPEGADVDQGAVAAAVGLEVTGDDDDDDEVTDATTEPAADDITKHPAMMAVRAEVEALQDQRKKDRREKHIADGAAYAAKVVGAGRAAAVEFSAIAEGYVRAALLDDERGETVTFSTGKDAKGEPVTKQGTHLDAFKFSIDIRPARHFGEYLGGRPAASFALENEGTKVDPEKDVQALNDKHFSRRGIKPIGAN